MGKTRNFTQNADKLGQAIIEATETGNKPRKTYTPEEQEQYKNTFTTRGRKGVKMARINMAFTDENYTFIKTMSLVSGQTMTEYTNKIIALYAEAHQDLYEEALAFRARI